MALNEGSIYIARQPILDGNMALWAYELLFRDCNPNKADVTDASSATAQVLRNSVTMGLKNVVYGTKALFNCDRDIILSDVLYMIDSSVFILEILENVELDDNVIAAIKRLKEQNNFLIALDDFIYNEKNIIRAEKVMDYIDIIKVDLLQTPKELWEKSANYINGHGKISLAEKVEILDDFEQCKRYGFGFFQGYFFAKPQLIERKKISANAATAIDLLMFIRKDGCHKKIARKFKESPEMTLGLLKLINSAAFGLRNTISSVLHAITLFGTKNLERWLILLLYADRGAGIVIEPLSPLFENANMRASVMENIANVCNESLSEKAYFVGLMSRTDALFGMPIATVLDEFNFDEEINSAVLHGEGLLGEMLRLVYAYENDNTEEVEKLIVKLNIAPEKFSQCVQNSYGKVLFRN